MAEGLERELEYEELPEQVPAHSWVAAGGAFEVEKREGEGDH